MSNSLRACLLVVLSVCVVNFALVLFLAAQSGSGVLFVHSFVRVEEGCSCVFLLFGACGWPVFLCFSGVCVAADEECTGPSF